MNKNIISIIVVAIVLGGLFILTKSDKNESMEGVNTDEASDSNVSLNGEEATKTTLDRLIKRGGDFECTFSHSTEVGDSSGIVYISGEKVKGEFTSDVKIAGLGTIKTYMISDGDFTYTWSDVSPQGYKSKVVEDKSNSNDQIPSDQELDYNCSGWVAQDSYFKVPGNITFVETN